MILSSFIAFIFTIPLDIIYWIKWVIAYTTIRFQCVCRSKRLNVYDTNAIGDPVKLGYITPQVERDLESPFPETHLAEAADEVCFYGVNSKSEYLLVRISRGANQVSDAWIYLKLANGKTYHLFTSPGHQQPFDDGKCLNFSCGGLQMHYLSPMRRWRIFFCGMLNESSENKEEPERSIFVKFVFLWKASSDVYDLTLDTNPCGFAKALGRSEWSYPFVPPIYRFMDAMNFYAQSGVVNGTVSVNDANDYEMYLFGEKMRNLGKSTNMTGSKFTLLLGNINENGLTFHLGNGSAPHIFKNLPFGFIVFPDAHLENVKEVDIAIESYNNEKVGSEIKASFTGDSKQKYQIQGNSIVDPIILDCGQGWSGFIEISICKFTMGSNKGSGLLINGEVRQESLKPIELKPNPSLPKYVPRCVSFSEEISHFGEVSGGKGSSLGKLTRLSREERSFTVPKGIIVTTSAYKEFLTAEIEKEIENLESVLYRKIEGNIKDACVRISSVIEKTPLPNEICHSIMENLKGLFGDEVKKRKFAVRSSATGEDTAAMSAAGQMDTFLGVQGLKEIFLAVKKCWASQFGYIATEYKRRNGQLLNSPMAVVIQEMVACDVSGVLFTCDPVNNNPSVITITANYGLGETVVSGSVEPDTIILKRDVNGHLEFDSEIIGTKSQRIIMQDSGGTIVEDLPEDYRRDNCLTKEAAKQLGEIAIKIERYYKSTRDIEWGILNNDIYILQSRPVTNAATETKYEIKHEFDAPLRCESEYFTKANIGEILPGATSPLGLELFIKFFNIIFSKDTKKKGMVEIIKAKYFNTGIVGFYNHAMTTAAEMAVVYGYNTPKSKGFQVSLFGRILDDEEFLKFVQNKYGYAPPPPNQKLISRFYNYWELFCFDFGSESLRKKISEYHFNFLKCKTSIETFRALLNSCSDFDAAGFQHIACTYSSSNWNFYLLDVLQKAQGSLDSGVFSDFARLLSTSANVETLSVPQAMQDVADHIGKDIHVEKFKSMSVEEALDWLQNTNLPSGQIFRSFLQNHGHRCVKELDIRTYTWGMEPKPLVKLLQSLAGFSKDGKMKEEEDYEKLFSELHVHLGFHSRCMLKMILPQCRRAIRGRETAKAIFVKSFDNWRQGYRFLAQQMVVEGRIPNEDLIYFMTLDEIKDLLETRSPAIISRANHRQKMYPIIDEYKFPEIMHGIPKPINDDTETANTYEFVADFTMKGISVSQGVAKGFARVAVTLEDASHLKPGEILITYCTDIGWSPYFPIISGIVTELGGLISHGAVVSREYGLPCIVGLQDATKRFKTGDYVLLDGKKGILQRLPKPEE